MSMRSGLLLLPFISVFTLILAIATGRTYKEIPLVSIVFYVVAGLSLSFWLWKDSVRLGGFFHRKGARHGISQGLSVVLAILLALGVGYLSKRERFNKSIDVTRAGVNTLSDESLKLIRQLNESKEPVQVLGFFQSEEKKAEFRKTIALYQMKGAPLSIEYVDPQTDPTRAMAENITLADTVLLKRGRQEARLTAFSEEKVTNAFVRVMKEKDKTIYFLSGHGEADLDGQDEAGYQLAKKELESERFVVKTLNLFETGKIPEDADLLIIAGPKYDIRAEEKVLLEAYLREARPLMVLVDALVQVPLLNDVLASTGMRLNDDLLVIQPGDPRIKLLGQNNAIVTEFDPMSTITADFAKRSGVALLTPFSRSIGLVSDNPLKLKPLALAKSSNIIVKIAGVKTVADVKGEIGPDRFTSGIFDVFAVANGQVGGDKLASSDGGDQKTADLKADAAGKSAKELRVFVGGSSHLASNGGVQRQENFDFFMNAINYLLQDEDFISIRAKDETKSQLDLTSATSQFLLLGMTWIYPFIFLGAGTFYWLRRRSA
jgi:ABC-type uncharacterized transport system involved in gliding motility auxiliary subunit